MAKGDIRKYVPSCNVSVACSEPNCIAHLLVNLSNLTRKTREELEKPTSHHREEVLLLEHGLKRSLDVPSCVPYRLLDK